MTKKQFTEEEMTVEEANKRIEAEIAALIKKNLDDGYGTPEEYERAARYFN